MIRYGKIRSLFAPAGYGIALLLGIAAPEIALLVCAVIPLLYILPGAQFFWSRIAM